MLSPLTETYPSLIFVSAIFAPNETACCYSTSVAADSLSPPGLPRLINVFALSLHLPWSAKSYFQFSFSKQIETPIIDVHQISRWILNLTFLEQRESKLATDRIRRGIIYRRKGVHEWISMIRARLLNDCFTCFRCNPLSLIGRQNEPTHFINELITPVLFPIANIPNRFRSSTQDNCEHVIRFRQV